MAIYTFQLNAQRNGVVAQKADDTDPLDTEWTQKDGVSFSYPMNREIKAMGVKYDSNDSVVRIVTQEEGDGTNCNVRYHEFDPATDKWTVRGILIGSVTTPTFFAADASYRVETGSNDKVAVARKNTNRFTHYSDTGAGWVERGDTTTSEGGVSLSLPDSSSRTRILKSIPSVLDVSAVAILTGDTRGSSGNLDVNVDSTDSAISNIVIDSSGIAYAAYIDASNKISLGDAQTAVDSPTWTTFTDISTNTVYGHGRTAVPYAAFFLAVKTDELHLIYVDDTDKDIQHVGDVQGGGGTETEVQAGTGDIARVSGSYFATQDKIGILYEDAGVSKFVFHDLAAAGAGVEVLPGVTALEMTLQTPTIETGVEVLPGVTALEMVLQTPVIGSGAGVAVPLTVLEMVLQTPAVASGAGIAPSSTTLELILQTPTIETGVEILPGVTALEMTLLAPIIETGVEVLPGVTALEMVLQTPVIGSGASVDAPLTVLEMILQTPAVASGVGIASPVTTLEMTLFAPSIETGVEILPGVTTLELILQTPTIGSGVAVLPGTTTLEMVLQTPAIAGGAGIIAPVTALEMVLFAPSIETGVEILPGVTTLEMVLFEPSITTAGVNISPGTTTLEMTLQVPVVGSGASLTVPLTVLEMTLQSPAVGTSVDIQPGTTTLEMTLLVPTIETGQEVEILPDATTLEMVLFAPAVAAGEGINVPLTVLEMILQTPSIETGVEVLPGVTTLEMVLFASTIETGVAILPGTTTLEMVLFAPSVETGVEILPDVTALEMTLLIPTLEVGAEAIEILPDVTTLEMSLLAPAVSIGENIAVPLTALEMVLNAPAVAIGSNIFVSGPGVSNEEIDADWNNNEGDNELASWSKNGTVIKANNRIEVTVDGAGGDDRIWKPLSETKSEQFCSFDFTLASGHTFAAGESTSGTGLWLAVNTQALMFGIAEDSGSLSWMVNRRRNVSADEFLIDNTTFPVVDDVPIRVEMRHLVESTPAADDGVVQVWIDGSMAYEETGISNSAVTIGFAEIGHVPATGTPALDFHVDNFLVGDNRRSLEITLQTPVVATGEIISVPVTTLEMIVQTPAVGTSVDISVPATTLEMTLQTPIVKSAPKVFPGVTTLEMILQTPAIASGVNIAPVVISLEMGIIAPRVDMIVPFAESAGMFDIGSLNRPQVPVFPYGTILTDRSDGNVYLLDINLPLTQTRMSSINVRNGLRVYPTYSARGGPVINGFRVYSDNGVLFTEKVTKHSVSNPPVHNLTADSSAIYELEMDDKGVPEWTLT